MLAEHCTLTISESATDLLHCMQLLPEHVARSNGVSYDAACFDTSIQLCVHPDFVCIVYKIR